MISRRVEVVAHAAEQPFRACLPGTHVITCWQGGLSWELFWRSEVLTVSGKRGGQHGEELVVRFHGIGLAEAMGVEVRRMASKWIQAAVAAASGTSMLAEELDPVLGKDRPALTDFMLETDAGDGRTREVSPLMVVMCEGGLKVGLKDAESGKWLWKTAKTLKAALDAIEKDLQSGKPAWSGGAASRGQGKSKR